MNIKPSVFAKPRPTGDVIEHVSDIPRRPTSTIKTMDIRPSVFSKSAVAISPHIEMKTKSDDITEKKKIGRPSKKEELMKRLASVSDNIRALVSKEPSKTDVRDYLKQRLSQLKTY
jgi:hypothetical protein